jgi:hypothetical protein
MEYDKLTYNFICDDLEKDGWDKETIFIDEKMKYTVSLNSSKPGETKLIADIICPEDEKILIRGVKNGDVRNYKDAYSIRLTLGDCLGNEISKFTKISISKVTSEEVSHPIRCFYTDISKKDDDHLYRPKENILLQGGDHLFIYVTGENIGQKLPDVAIERDRISFSIKADILRNMEIK